MKQYLQTLCILSLALSIIECIKLEQKYSWHELDYDWPSEETKKEAIRDGSYKMENNLPLGFDLWRDKMFITVPRWKSGVASSLNYIKLSDEQSPILHPYPSWETNTFDWNATADTTGEDNEINERFANNASIVSTFRISVDECDRLWVMDTGLTDILGTPKQILPPALLIFDLNTDKLVRRFTFPSKFYKEDSFYANVVVDSLSGQCDDAFAYIPDLGEYVMIVYSFKENKSWQIKHNFFHFDPLNGNYNVGGVNFQWTDGVFALAIGNKKTDGTRSVYFHALSSTKEFEVSNRVLQNETYATDATASYFDYKLIGDRGENGQSTSQAFDKKSEVIFFTQVNKDAIGCWNTNKPYTVDNTGLVDSDSDALIFPNDLKIDSDRNVWILSNRMPIFIYKSLNPKEYNYRILKGKADDLIAGTPCA